MTSWRSSDGTWRIIDKELYRKVNEQGRATWVHVSISQTWLESKLLDVISEILEELNVSSRQ